jgi:outer membrane lipoprotein SlyB
MTACTMNAARNRGLAGRLLAAGMLLCLFAPALSQSIKIPDFREERASAVSGPRPGEACDGCGVIRSIREIRIDQPVGGVPNRPESDSFERGVGSGVPIGAVIALPTGEGGSAYVGGVGTPEMRERFSQTSYEISVRLDNGAVTTVQRRDGSRYRVGDRVRVRGVQMELLAS